MRLGLKVPRCKIEYAAITESMQRPTNN